MTRVLNERDQALYHELVEARGMLQQAIDDLRFHRDVGLVAFEAQRAADTIQRLVQRHHSEPELTLDEAHMLEAIRTYYVEYDRGCTLQELRRATTASAKDAKRWTRSLLRMGLIRKEAMGSRLVPGARRATRWRMVA